jgi:hypothetical protein
MDSWENLIVFGAATGYRVLTEMTRETVYQATRADKAIQWAIDALAKRGGQVALGRGDFPIEESLVLASSVKLCGGGRSSKLRVRAGGVGLRVEQRRDVEIQDLSIVAEGGEAKTGLLIDDSGACQVRNVYCAGFARYGIWVRNNTFLCEIRGCTLAGNGEPGVGANLYLDHLARGRYGNFVPNLITNCTIYGGGKGIECNRTIVLNIVACVVYQTQGAAYTVRNTSNSVLISGCRSFQITGPAVLVDDSHEFNLSSNIFCWHTEQGVLVRNCNWGTIAGNEVIDTGSYNPGGPDHATQFSELPDDVPQYNGIELLNAQGYSVTGNTVFNWGVCPKMLYGIREDAQSYRNTITGNNVNYYDEGDVLSEGRESIAGHNAGYPDLPYQSGESAGTSVQSFEAELTARFIREQTET